MLTFVGVYAVPTFSSWLLVTSGASSPQPSASVGAEGAGALDREPNGLKAAEPPPTRVGWKTGFDATGGGPPLLAGAFGPPPYFAPDASATFCVMLSGVRSRSERAVTCT